MEGLNPKGGTLGFRRDDLQRDDLPRDDLQRDDLQTPKMVHGLGYFFICIK